MLVFVAHCWAHSPTARAYAVSPATSGDIDTPCDSRQVLDSQEWSPSRHHSLGVHVVVAFVAVKHRLPKRWRCHRCERMLQIGKTPCIYSTIWIPVTPRWVPRSTLHALLLYLSSRTGADTDTATGHRAYPKIGGKFKFSVEFEKEKNQKTHPPKVWVGFNPKNPKNPRLIKPTPSNPA